jgi:hypothetical protein
MRIGAEVVDGAGPAAAHRQIHNATVGKTIEAVYLGQVELDEPYNVGGNDRTEYVLLRNHFCS